MIDWLVVSELLLQWITLTFMLVGLVGLVIPIFPGIVVIWLSAFFYAILQALVGRMGVWDWLLFALITTLMIIGSFIDNIIIAKKLRETGTPWRSIGIGYAAGLVSSLFLTPFAALIITPLALYAVEYLRLRNYHQAFDSAKGWLIGFGWTFLVLVAIGATMIGLWLLWIWY
ncbi:MAG: DUF456 domain-containing protein [Chloroflexi bacterium]|nr:DUF456 domain-containing protein [Chloroflexota bacterium]